MKELANKISKWMKEYAESANRKSFVIGVSGGVDSALVSTLCAMTGLDTHCVVLPCQTKPDQTVRGYNHIDWLFQNYRNVRLHTIDLTTTFEQFKNTVVDKYDNKLAFANTKSRLRMIALYQIATCTGGLVVGTGNKVEDFGIGFCTKYGDSGVDISPISTLLKSEVRKMCRDLRVLPELSEAIPTDGLWEDTRTDEGQLGATYDELEWAMDFRESNDPEDSHLWSNKCNPRQLEVLAIYDRWHAITRHKFEPIPEYVR